MADCELCTLAKPTLIPIKVQAHTLAYSAGVYKGVCKDCLNSLEAAYMEYFGNKEEEEKKA